MNWRTRAQQLVSQHGNKWYLISDILSKELNEYIPSERIRRYIRDNGVEEQKLTLSTSSVLDCVRTGRYSIEDMADIHEVDTSTIASILDELCEDGYCIETVDSKVVLSTVAMTNENKHYYQWDGEEVIRFGVVSDCHIGSKYQQITNINKMYDIFSKEEVSVVYNIGDLTEGCKMRTGHEYEIFLHGADDQTNYIIDKYPKRAGIITRFILGNHDAAHIKNGGHDIGKVIARDRKDMEYLGMLNAQIMLTPKCKLEMHHPLNGSSYALSYSTQKYIDSLSGIDKPNILLVGHYHKAEYIFYRNIHTYQAGCFQAQSQWMKGKNLSAHTGGWIIEIHVNSDGTITRSKGEFFPFYTSLKNDY